MTNSMYLLLERLQRIDDALRLAQSAQQPDTRTIAILSLRRAWVRHRLARMTRVAAPRPLLTA